MNMKKYFELGLIKLLEQKCIDNITVNEIVAEVGSCKGTFYKHYLDKYDLCNRCFENNVFCNISETGSTWAEFVKQSLTAIEKFPSVILHAFNSDDLNSARHTYEDMVTGFLTKEFIRHGGAVDMAMNRISLKICGASVTDIIIEWLKNGRKESKDAIVQLVHAVMPQVIYTKVYSAA
ncbi:MAG: TetR/AcrR family transcriptional regulator [Clostridia bacterium]|nr:TetR/AcrR family transcriptional regulator [Clostridia bacterium]